MGKINGEKLWRIGDLKELTIPDIAYASIRLSCESITNALDTQ